jgi:hypothetical protein
MRVWAKSGSIRRDLGYEASNRHTIRLDRAAVLVSTM